MNGRQLFPIILNINFIYTAAIQTNQINRTHEKYIVK